MADISEWSPVDESNNQPPPNGFPEFQSPSSLNNGARAMMGAVRRWYDTITLQLASLTTSLAGYLPLTGGTISGNLAVNGTGGVSISSVQLRNVLGGLDIFTAGTATGAGGIFVHGPESGVFWGDNDQVSPNWGWYASGGVAYFWHGVTGNVATVTSDGSLTARTALNTIQYQIQGIPFAQRNATNDAFHIFDVSGNLSIALHAGDNYYRADNHHWQNEAATETATLNSAGALSLLGTLSAPAVSTGTFAASGTITASGTISAGAMSAGTITASGAVSAGTVSAGTVTASGAMYCTSSSATDTVFATTVAASGTVTAATLTLNGSVPTAESGRVNAVNVAATGTVSGNLLTGNSIHSNNAVNATTGYSLRSVPFASMDAGFGNTVLYDPNGPNITMYGNVGATNYYDNNEHRLRNRGGGVSFAWFLGSGNFQGDNASAWDTVSDAALKTDVAPYDRGLAAILQLQPISYRFAAGPFDREKIHHGLMAQDVASVVPEMVGQTEIEIDGEMRSVATLNPGNLTYILCNAVRELAARIEALEGEP